MLHKAFDRGKKVDSGEINAEKLDNRILDHPEATKVGEKIENMSKGEETASDVASASISHGDDILQHDHEQESLSEKFNEDGPSDQIKDKTLKENLHLESEDLPISSGADVSEENKPVLASNNDYANSEHTISTSDSKSKTNLHDGETETIKSTTIDDSLTVSHHEPIKKSFDQLDSLKVHHEDATASSKTESTAPFANVMHIASSILGDDDASKEDKASETQLNKEQMSTDARLHKIMNDLKDLGVSVGDGT